MHIIMATIIEMWFIGSKLLLVEFAGMGTRATKNAPNAKLSDTLEHMRIHNEKTGQKMPARSNARLKRSSMLPRPDTHDYHCRHRYSMSVPP